MKKFISLTAAVLLISTIALAKDGTPGKFSGKLEQWNGFDMYTCASTETGQTIIVVPKKAADGKPWIWRARFWGHQPQFDIAMLNKGFHIAYCDISNLYGSPKAVERWNNFYQYLYREHLFAEKVVLEGMSRGGLIIYNWAAANPEKVAVIYGDNPVMDFKSWPGPKNWGGVLKAYDFTAEEAMAYKKNPVDNLAPLAKAGVPIIHVVGDQDTVVPIAENTSLAETRYKKMGGIFEVIHENKGHHPHCLKDPTPLVDFVLKHTKGKDTATDNDSLVGDKNFTIRGNFNNSRIQFESGKGHVAFIGGSITEAKGYRVMVEKALQKRFPNAEFTFTSAGISSTGSTTAAFRLNEDVFGKGPLDLFFVEFSVNDDQDGMWNRENCIKGLEGVIVQARKHNPNVDIIYTHFVNPKILDACKQGKDVISIKAHSDVLANHKVSQSHLAQEVADQVNAGRIDWKKFGGTHPSEYGNSMAAAMLTDALFKAWAKPLPAGAKKVAHAKASLLDAKSYTNGRTIPLEKADIVNGFEVSVAKWANDKKVRAQFKGKTLLHSETPGSKFTLDFTGTAVGAFMLAGRDTAVIKCTVDGGEPKVIDTIHNYSGFPYPRSVMFFNDLDNGKHKLELEILDSKDYPNRLRKAQGSALRILRLVAN